MFNRAEYKISAKHRLNGSWKYMAIIYAILFGFILFYGIFSKLPVLGISLSLCFGSCLLFGTIRMSRRLHNGEKISFTDVLSGFPHLVKCVGLALWIGLWVSLWSCLFVIPGIAKMFSYSMAFYALEEDPTISIREALNRSKKMTKGRTADLLMLQLSWLGWIFLSIFTFGLAMFWLIPYLNLTEYQAYIDLRKLHFA